MPEALRSAGLGAEQVADLSQRHDGSALEFAPGENQGFQSLLLALLTNLFGSDFLLSFPDRPVVCTVHHHKQLWWTTSDAEIYADIESGVARAAREGT